MTTSCVPFKITIEGQEFEAYITEKNFELISKLLNKNKKKTGYERVEHGENFYHTSNSGHWITQDEDVGGAYSNDFYSAANYYSSQELAQNNARADNLMRQLRRLAVEYRKNDDPTERFYIYYLKTAGILQLRRDSDNCYIGPWFDSLHAGANAIEAFKDELIWYFTEYRDSL